MSRHGTIYDYKVRGCRCDVCREAQRVYQLAWMRRVQSRIPVDAPAHGTLTRYRSYGCRCPSCTEINSTECRRWKQRKEAASTPGP